MEKSNENVNTKKYSSNLQPALGVWFEGIVTALMNRKAADAVIIDISHMYRTKKRQKSIK